MCILSCGGLDNIIMYDYVFSAIAEFYFPSFAIEAGAYILYIYVHGIWCNGAIEG